MPRPKNPKIRRNPNVDKEGHHNYTNAFQTLAYGADMLIKAAVRLSTISFDKEFESIAARVDNLMTEIDALAKKNSLNAALVGDSYVSAISNSISSVMQGINEGAYASAQSLIDLGTQDKLRQLEFNQIDLERANDINLRNAQKHATFRDLNAEQNEATISLKSAITRKVGSALNDVGIFGVELGDLPGAIADFTATMIEAPAMMTNSMIHMEDKLVVQYWENQKKVTEAQLQATQDVEKEWIESAAQVEKAWLQLAQQLENKLVQADFAANDMGIGMGLSGKDLAKFKSDMMAEQVKVSSRWGKTLTEMQQTQTSYQENIGNNVQMSSRDFDTTFALDKLAGTDGLSNQLASAMAPFNKSISSSNDMVFEMFQNVSKMGLSGRKYMKDLLKNLKLAEKHQFKGGVKGLMKMAAWASKTKFNMDSLDGMLDKISEGGLEGVITQAAQLQVLGGASAMGADPLAMMFERYNDPAAYAKRMNSMTRDMGTFNEKTGETWFNQVDQMRIEAMAKAQGRSKEDLFAEVRERNKRANIEKKIQPGKFNDDQLTAISSKAQWNQDKGQWEITMNNGEAKAVTDFSADDIKNIMPTETNERIEMYVYDIREMMTRLTAANGGMQAQLQSDGYSQWISEENQRIAQVTSEFRENYSKYLSEFKEKMSDATRAQKTMLDMMGAGNANIDAEIEAVRQAGAQLAATINAVTAQIASNLTEINNQAQKRTPLAKNPDTGLEEVAYNVDHRNFAGDYMTFFAWDGYGRGMTSLVNDYLIGYGNQINRQTPELLKPYLSQSPQPSHDSVMQSEGGQSMLTTATSVMPIHDGAVQVAQSDPKDTAIFAKDGGPFDTLFNGIFGEVNNIHSMLLEASEMPQNRVLSPEIKKVSTPGNGELKITFDKPISLDGKIELTSGGQSIDVISEIQKNPQLLRTLTQMLSEEISKNMFGGRSVNNGFNLTGGLGSR